MKTLNNTQAASIAAQWNEGQYSALYKLNCVLRRQSYMDFVNERLLLCCLREVSHCIDSFTHDKNKFDYKYDEPTRNTLRDLCLLRSYINALLMRKQAEMDMSLLLRQTHEHIACHG